MSDDDSESDIETMFQDAHNNIVRKTDEQYDDDDDDDDDNDSDNDSDNNDKKTKTTALDNPHSFDGSSKKGKKSVFDKKLDHLSLRKAKQQKIDKVNSVKLKQDVDDDDDDDDFLNDNAVNAASTTNATTASTTRNGMTTRSVTTTTTSAFTTTKPSNYVEPISLLDSDDDDNDDSGGKAAFVTNLNSTRAFATAATTAHINQLYPPYFNTLLPSYLQQQIPTGMNPFHAAMIRGKLVPDMILPPSIHPRNQQCPTPNLLSSIPLQHEYQQQQERIKSTAANNTNTINVDDIPASNPNVTLNQSNNAQFLRIKVIATIIPNQGSSLPLLDAGLPIVDLTSYNPTTSSSVSQIRGSRTVSCMVDILETKTVQALMDRILEQCLHLNLKQHVIGLQYNSDTLYRKNALDVYRIPEKDATIMATIYSSDHTIVHTNTGNGTNSSSSRTNTTGRSVNASSFAKMKPKAHVPKGTIINLISSWPARPSWPRWL